MVNELTVFSTEGICGESKKKKKRRRRENGKRKGGMASKKPK
jgi:hypothetical protein